MPHIIATDRALYWAVGEPVVASGLTEVGGATVTGLPMVSAADENAFLAQTVTLAGDYNPLPDAGWLEAGSIYGYSGGLVIVRQSHDRTIYAPEDTPALFSVYRADAAEALVWIANEPVQMGTRRLYDDVLYECIQAHTTQTDWVPPALPALWKVVQEEPVPDAWAVGVAYTGDNTAGAGNGDVVTYNGRLYRCWQSHTSIAGWEPPNVPALWIDLGPV